MEITTSASDGASNQTAASTRHRSHLHEGTDTVQPGLNVVDRRPTANDLGTSIPGEASKPTTENPEPSDEYKIEYVWKNIIFFIYLHIGAAIGAFLLLVKAKWCTFFWFQFLVVATGLGVTAGAHRLWSHKSYKASFPIRLLLVIFNTIGAQNHIIEWARDHRVHHKYSETSADPHDATRGLFFSHMGWLLVRKHPDVKTKGKGIDISDLESDPILSFQRKYYTPLMLFFNYVFPALVARCFWGESILIGFTTCSLLRYCYVLHTTWSINSIAHWYGHRPYDKNINPRENIVTTIGALGEGWHNYHHTFPYDYRASEWGWSFNITTFLLDALAAVGLVFDRKQAPQDIIDARKQRTGEF